MAGLVGGPGAEREREREFSEICKNSSLRKLQKMPYLSIIFKKFNKQCVILSRGWTKNINCWEIFDDNSIENLNFYLFL